MGAFKVDWGELGRFPFRISHDDFNPKAGSAALGRSGGGGNALFMTAT